MDEFCTKETNNAVAKLVVVNQNNTWLFYKISFVWVSNSHILQAVTTKLKNINL
jgi:transposase-like protein